MIGGQKEKHVAERRREPAKPISPTPVIESERTRTGVPGRVSFYCPLIAREVPLPVQSVFLTLSPW